MLELNNRTIAPPFSLRPIPDSPARPLTPRDQHPKQKTKRLNRIIELTRQAKALGSAAQPLFADLSIAPVPGLTPWGSNSSYVSGSSARIENSVARLTLGPCAYLVAHWHATAWEVITPISPTNALTSFLQDPAPGSMTKKTLIQPGQSFTYPQGWLHLSFNDNCTPTDAILVWNAADAGGTFTEPQALSGLNANYDSVAFTAPLPSPAGLWVVNKKCAARCGL